MPEPNGRFEGLRQASPMLYRICTIVIGVGAGFAIYRSVASNVAYSELLGFVGFGVLLIAIAVVLEAVSKVTWLKVASACVVIIGGVSWYLWSAVGLEINDHSPTIALQTTWCDRIGVGCLDTEGVMSDPVLQFAGDSTQIEGTDPSSPEAVIDYTTDATLPNPDTEHLIYFQFAGALSRQDEIIPFLNRLTDLGWVIASWEQGGERTPSAAGVNEVRYFYVEDQENAERLALAVEASSPPDGSGSGLQVVFLSAERFGNPNRGLLELWMSN